MICDVDVSVKAEYHLCIFLNAVVLILSLQSLLDTDVWLDQFFFRFEKEMFFNFYQVSFFTEYIAFVICHHIFGFMNS